ncbi:hypothetical protein AAFC00_002191 [Neodothiora populina]|uniref:Phosphatidate phosphatase APP1 catalytic domain-containing protein n=1 Tax=Neodothiora populina TaxID=2781224 RepID=A0ABR3PGZ0_9PEZI
MSYRGTPSVYADSLRAPPESGGKRKKLAGYLKAANELRQSYTANWNGSHGSHEYDDDAPGAFPDAAVVRSGDEEMILFPGYARKHTKSKPRAQPGTIQQVAGTGRDYRDTTGSGDAEFWKQQWEQYENDRAIVDVDVRGWIYNPHKGPLSRKHRLMVGLARQLVGLPAPSGVSSPSSSRPGSRSTSPVRDAPSKREQEIVSQQADEIVRRGETEAAIAGQGGFSELPSRDSDGRSVYGKQSASSSPSRSSADHLEVLGDTDSINPVRKRQSWTAPGKMSQAELSVANNHLMARLKPFMANPIANATISAFFYNDKVSRQRTINTDASGHFHLRASLDFIPTHVRVLASDRLSATEEVQVTSSRGVSLITDIDDTIKHSAISSGAREIFRNAFIRDLGDLIIDGVQPWYTKLADMGVKLHYVSNSPWQLYPVLTTFCKMAGLPRGSYHLKQYSGMLQGIFEPVAERKKATMERIMRDFPDRKFVLVGDSGEADLEVYVDTVLEYPGRILGIFIRDVTTPDNKGFFDPSMGPLSNGANGGKRTPKHKSTESLISSKQLSRPNDIQDDENELREAIAASLKDMEEETARTRRSVFLEQPPSFDKFPTSDDRSMRPALPPRRPTDPPAPQASAIEDDLIDFSDDESPAPALPRRPNVHSRTTAPPLNRVQTDSPTRKALSPPPPLKIKPPQLRSPSPLGASQPATANASKPPPPKPRKPSTTVNTMVPSPLSQNSPIVGSPPPLEPPPPKQTYGAAAKKKLNSAYNVLPSAPKYLGGSPTKSSKPSATTALPAAFTDDEDRLQNTRIGRSTTARSLDDARPPSQLTAPPPPPRRNLSSYPAAAAQYASNRLSGTWGGSEPPSNSSSANSTWGPSFDTTSTAAANNPYGGGSQTPLNKKEEMWKRRWARAKDLMDQKGVVLRAWRVGSDVEGVCLALVRQALKENNDHDRDDIQSGSSRSGSGSGSD